jgi:hypothetical protein
MDGDRGGLEWRDMLRVTVAAMFVAAGAVVVGNATSADSHDDDEELPVPSIVVPERVYGRPALPLAFAGPKEVIKAFERTIIAVVTAPECELAPGNTNVTDCASVDLQIQGGVDRGQLALLVAEEAEEVFRASSGALVEPGAYEFDDPILRSPIIRILGTPEQINSTLAELVFLPNPGNPLADPPVPPYEYSGSPILMTVRPVNGEDPPGGGSRTGEQVFIEIYIQEPNEGPELTMPEAPDIPMLVAKNSSPNAVPEISVDDPDLNKVSSADRMLLAVFTTCGDFRPSAGTYQARTSVAQLLFQDTDLPEPARDALELLLEEAIEAVVPDFPTTFSSDGGLLNYRTATLALVTLDNANAFLGGLEYRAPNDDILCNLFVVVSDLGRHGLPVAYTLGIETPDLGLDWGVVSILVGDGPESTTTTTTTTEPESTTTTTTTTEPESTTTTTTEPKSTTTTTTEPESTTTTTTEPESTTTTTTEPESTTTTTTEPESTTTTEPESTTTTTTTTEPESTTTTTTEPESTTTTTTEPESTTTTTTTTEPTTTTTIAMPTTTTTIAGQPSPVVGPTTLPSTDCSPPAEPPVPDGPLGADPSSIVAGGQMQVFGDGFIAGERVCVVLYSTPVVLAAPTASSTGSMSATVVVPADTAPGPHRLVAIGDEQVLELMVTVVASEPPLTPTSPPVTGLLPGTGGGGNGMVPPAVLLLVVGWLAVVVGRRPARR